MPHRLALLLALSLLTLPTRAEAANAADEADLAFELGNELYAKGRYAEALREYFVSHRLVPNRNVLFNIARCYEQLERFDEAYRYFNDLAAQELPPADRRDVERNLQRLRPRVALVKVVTEPPGADVYVDRVDLGSRGLSPQTLALPAGKHVLKVHLKGYFPAEAKVSLTRGRELVETIPLTLITGKVRVKGTPPGAWVRESEN